MKLAVMQPYFLPYIGYWQLIAAVDRFVVLDDVAFIHRGWIHRNRILVNGTPHLFTLPVSGASQNRLICEMERTDADVWHLNFRKTLRQSYGRAAHFDETMNLQETLLANPEPNLSRSILESMRAIASHLGINTELVSACGRYSNHQLKGQERAIDICRREGASNSSIRQAAKSCKNEIDGDCGAGSSRLITPVDAVRWLDERGTWRAQRAMGSLKTCIGQTEW
jgi:hypothetical protein